MAAQNKKTERKKYEKTPVPAKSPNLNVRSAGKHKAAPSYEVIALKAYEIWLAEGRQPGCDRKNWFEAKAQLLAA